MSRKQGELVATTDTNEVTERKVTNKSREFDFGTVNGVKIIHHTDIKLC